MVNELKADEPISASEALKEIITSRALGNLLGVSGRQIRKARQGHKTALKNLEGKTVIRGLLASPSSDEQARVSLFAARKRVRDLELVYVNALIHQNEILRDDNILPAEFFLVMNRKMPDNVSAEQIKEAKGRLNKRVMHTVNDARQNMDDAIAEARGVGYRHYPLHVLRELNKESVVQRMKHKPKSKKGSSDIHNPNHKVTEQQMLLLVQQQT